jgi:hypothetical protein
MLSLFFWNRNNAPRRIISESCKQIIKPPGWLKTPDFRPEVAPEPYGSGLLRTGWGTEHTKMPLPIKTKRDAMRYVLVL